MSTYLAEPLVYLRYRRGTKVCGNYEVERVYNLIGGLQAAAVLYGICTRPISRTINRRGSVRLGSKHHHVTISHLTYIRKPAMPMQYTVNEEILASTSFLTSNFRVQMISDTSGPSQNLQGRFIINTWHSRERRLLKPGTELNRTGP